MLNVTCAWHPHAMLRSCKSCNACSLYFRAQRSTLPAFPSLLQTLAMASCWGTAAAARRSRLPPTRSGPPGRAPLAALRQSRPQVRRATAAAATPSAAAASRERLHMQRTRARRQMGQLMIMRPLSCPPASSQQPAPRPARSSRKKRWRRSGQHGMGSSCSSLRRRRQQQGLGRRGRRSCSRRRLSCRGPSLRLPPCQQSAQSWSISGTAPRPAVATRRLPCSCSAAARPQGAAAAALGRPRGQQQAA